jgi:hypothetical protein
MKIHHHDVGLDFEHQPDRCLSGRRLTGDLEPMLLEQHPQTLAEKVVIVYEDDPDGTLLVHGSLRLSLRPGDGAPILAA